MRKAIGLLVLLLAIVVGWWLWAQDDEVTPSSSATERAAATQPTSPARSQDEVGQNKNRAVALVRDEKVRARARAERDALRKRILDSMHARQRRAEDQPSPASSTGESPGSTGSPPAGDGEETHDDPEGPATGGLTDRTGNHGYLKEVLDEELMPLTHECIQMAREARPDLAGMLVVDLSIIGDDELGGVVDTVGSGSNNEVLDPDLLECVSESILSITLPPPPQGGRDAIALSMPVADE
ncbi:MAG: hypothetical protein AAF799_05065 [Myxococcota bacterium]